MIHSMLAFFQATGADAATVARNTNALLGAGIGIGLSILGLGLGMGRIGGAVAEGVARQPEAAAEIASRPFIFAILLEGTTIIGLVFALLFKLIK